MDCYTNNFPGLPCFEKLTADKHVLAELLLVPFVIINLTRLAVGVRMKVRFKSKVTRGFSFSPLRDSCSPLRGSLMALLCGEKSRKASGTRVIETSRPATYQSRHSVYAHFDVAVPLLSVKKVSKTHQKSWSGGNGSALCAVIGIHSSL